MAEGQAQNRFAFISGPDRIADAIGRLGAERGTAVPILDGAACRRLIEASKPLAFRPAKPVVGEGTRIVRQDFTICMEVPKASLLGRLAESFGALCEEALDRLDPSPIERPSRFNDRVLQWYEPGSQGISSHRDHIRYVGLAALVVLTGRACFCVCDDRAGAGAREIRAGPGDVILLRGPGYGARRARPFHFLSDITERRLSFGLRHDLQKNANG